MVGCGRRSPPSAKGNGGGGGRRHGGQHRRGKSGGDVQGDGTEALDSVKAAVGLLEGTIQGETSAANAAKSGCKSSGTGASNSQQGSKEPIFALSASRSGEISGGPLDPKLQGGATTRKSIPTATRTPMEANRMEKADVKSGPEDMGCSEDSSNDETDSSDGEADLITAEIEMEANTNPCHEEVVKNNNLNCIQYARSPIKAQDRTKSQKGRRKLNGISVNSDGEEELHQECSTNSSLNNLAGKHSSSEKIRTANGFDDMLVESAPLATDNDVLMNDNVDEHLNARSALENASPHAFVAGTSCSVPNLPNASVQKQRTPSVCGNAQASQLSSSLQFLDNLQNGNKATTLQMHSGNLNDPNGNTTRLQQNPPAQSNDNRNSHDSHAGQRRTNGNNAWVRPVHIPVSSSEQITDFVTSDGVVQMNLESAKPSIAKLEKALVGKLLGRHIPFSVLKVDLSRKWAQFGLFKLTTVSNDCFICIFENTKARDAVLMGARGS